MNRAFLLAAGKSARFGSDKLFYLIRNKPILFYSLKVLDDSRRVDEILIAVNKNNKRKIERLVKAAKIKKVSKIILGGSTRFESVKRLAALLPVLPDNDRLVIHNGANPNVTIGEIDSCLAACTGSIKGVAVGRPAAATIKRISHGVVAETLPREDLWETETPQVVAAREFKKACLDSRVGVDYTDDLAVLEDAGYPTVVISADPSNRKITYPQDTAALGAAHAEYRVGIGEDSHEWSEKASHSGTKCLMLAGVPIKNMPPLAADSDGDVIIHALVNALQSAAGRGSLGTFATEQARRGLRSSVHYLRESLGMLRRKRMELVNCSIAIEAKNPKIDPLATVFKKSLAALLNIKTGSIGITATSGERLSKFGEGKGIHCRVAVSVRACVHRP